MMKNLGEIEKRLTSNNPIWVGPWSCGSRRRDNRSPPFWCCGRRSIRRSKFRWGRPAIRCSEQRSCASPFGSSPALRLCKSHTRSTEHSLHCSTCSNPRLAPPLSSPRCSRTPSAVCSIPTVRVPHNSASFSIYRNVIFQECC